MKIIIKTLACTLLTTTLSHGAEPENKIIHGVGDAEILMSSWKSKIRSWTAIEHRNRNLSFPLYELTPNTLEYSLGVDTSAGQISSNKNFLIIQRTVFGVFLDDKSSPHNTENTYCDVINITTGCVLLTRPSEYCSGLWENGKWLTDNGNSITPTLETPKPIKIIENIKALSRTEKATSIKEYMYMGADSYLACHPPQKQVQGINDLAYFLAEGGDNYNAMKLYRALEKSSPSRTVLKLNIADALWIDGKISEAKKYYKDYKTLMKNSGQSSLVPEYVIIRLQQPPM